MKKTGFLNTFISVCSGTEDFPKLIKQSFIHTLWNLLVLTFICSCVNVAFRLHPFNKSFEECCANLSRRFGEIEFSERGIVPSIKPEEARSATSLDDFRVDYLTDREDLKTYHPKEGFDIGVVWTPQTILLWEKTYSDGAWNMQPVIMPRISQIWDKYMTFAYDEDLMKTKSKFSRFYFYSEFVNLKPEDFKDKTSVNFRDFKTNMILWIPMSFSMWFASLEFLFIFLMVMVSLVYILFFTTFSYLFGRASLIKLKYFELFSLGVYTGFPGFAIATLFVALDLPVLDFQSIFLISYFIYSFAVFGRLRADKKPPEEKKTFEF